MLQIVAVTLLVRICGTSIAKLLSGLSFSVIVPGTNPVIFIVTNILEFRATYKGDAGAGV